LISVSKQLNRGKIANSTNGAERTGYLNSKERHPPFITQYTNPTQCKL
jgi:hypothetical protein